MDPQDKQQRGSEDSPETFPNIEGPETFPNIEGPTCSARGADQPSRAAEPTYERPSIKYPETAPGIVPGMNYQGRAPGIGHGIHYPGIAPGMEHGLNYPQIPPGINPGLYYPQTAPGMVPGLNYPQIPPGISPGMYYPQNAPGMVPGMPNQANVAYATNQNTVIVSQPGTVVAPKQTKPPATDAIVLSCCVLWCCCYCLPLGLFAFVFAVRSTWAADYNTAVKNLKISRYLSIAGIVGGGLTIMFIFSYEAVSQTDNDY